MQNLCLHTFVFAVEIIQCCKLCAGLQEQRLERLLNAAVSMGVLAHARRQPGKFCNTRVSAVLRKDHPNSVADVVRSSPCPDGMPAVPAAQPAQALEPVLKEE